MNSSYDERAGASILALGVLLCACFFALILGAIGAAYAAHAELLQAADVAAAVVESGVGDAPTQRARQVARANGANTVEVDEIEGGRRLRITVIGQAPSVFGLRTSTTIKAISWADIPAASAVGDYGPNPPGQYSGPLARAGTVMVCPAVAEAFDRMSAAARAGGVFLSTTSGFRTFAEQAVLYARLGPAIAAPPGVSRHHDATELDISVGPAGSSTHRWLSRHASSFGFIQRYSWEPWHWGFVRGC